VNGIEYSTAHAQVSIDEQPGTEAQLRVGQIVQVEGSVDPEGRVGEASDVVFFADVRGAVTQLNIKDRSIEVAGQTVRISDDTLISPDGPAITLEGLRKGTFVAVSGFADASGDLVASRIDVAPTEASLQLKGTVAGLDSVARTFHINALAVSYGEIAVEGRLVDGATVKVQGTGSPRGEVLQANRVKVEPNSAGSPGEYGDVEGLITSLASERQFTVGHQQVVTDSQTKFDLHGQRLVPNLSVRIKGVFNGAGALVAAKVTSHAQSSLILRGFVESLAGQTLTVNGSNVSLTEASVLVDHSALRLRSFGLHDLAVGDYVEIRVSPEPDSGLLVGSVVKRRKLPK
jgi:hypothetical protein